MISVLVFPDIYVHKIIYVTIHKGLNTKGGIIYWQ